MSFSGMFKTFLKKHFTSLYAFLHQMHNNYKTLREYKKTEVQLREDNISGSEFY